MQNLNFIFSKDYGGKTAFGSRRIGITSEQKIGRIG